MDSVSAADGEALVVCSMMKIENSSLAIIMPIFLQRKQLVRRMNPMDDEAPKKRMVESSTSITHFF